MGSTRTVLAVQIGHTEHVELAAHRGGEGTANRALTGDKLADSEGTRADSSSGGEAQESSKCGESGLHRG